VAPKSETAAKSRSETHRKVTRGNAVGNLEVKELPSQGGGALEQGAPEKKARNARIPQSRGHTYAKSGIPLKNGKRGVARDTKDKGTY